MKLKVKDPIIKRVVKKFVGRSNVGYKKYGSTLMDDTTEMDGWLNHLQEELMDAVNYIERAREEIKRSQEVTITSTWTEQPILYRDASGQWSEPPQPFRVCHCTLGTSGKCCQDV